MKTKNFRNFLFAVIVAILIFQEFLLANTIKACGSNSVLSSNIVLTGEQTVSQCGKIYSRCAGETIFNYTLSLFWALILWTISPIGILFFLASGVLISREPSKLKRKIAWIAQIVSFLMWMSLMLLILLVYLDSISLNVFHLGGRILNLAVLSGFGFAVVMFVFALIQKSCEKKIHKESPEEQNGKVNNSFKNKENKRNKNKKKRRESEGIKFAGIEFGDIKGKIRKKIKKELKEIVDEEIERRL